MKKRYKLLILSIVAILSIAAFFLGYVYYSVTLEASTRIERGAIDRIIASESHVYYDDGVTPIGTFFDKVHRKYIVYDDIPKAFIKALIAAEDKSFFDHSGFDFKAIIRALVANLRAGRVTQGGSTLTQQTAKNIFRREKRSYMAKLRELMQAFLLERRYGKQAILEMYANQFFVTGYGKGLRIAAQYFFDKDAKNLDLVESAFIAGSVKGPNRYNPFIKKSEAEKEKARQLAKARKNYVLSNMQQMNFITRAQYLEARDREVPFRQGEITFKLNVILDYIHEQLESEYFQKILREQGIENPATSGIDIYTSINRQIQEAGLHSLRSHLPLIDVKLNGYNVDQVPDIKKNLIEEGMKKSEDALPFPAQITQIDPNTEHAHVVVSWENGGGIIGYEGLKPIGEAWLRWKTGNLGAFEKRHVHSFLKTLRVGDLVPLQFMGSSENSDEKKLKLSKIPELEGALIVLQGGMVKAMIGGFFNRFFNRSVDAKRQLGSIFKPIVYTAAVQLKWNILDPLQNVRDVFRFQDTVYIPRPDHEPESDKVSMAWAGTKSENLATVWLLYHLTDQLNMSEFRQIVKRVGLDRRKDETYQQYQERIRDRHGIVVNEKALMEAAFEASKKEIESDIIFAGHEEILETLHRLHFNIESEELNAQGQEIDQVLRFGFQRLLELNQRMERNFQEIKRLLELSRQNDSPYLRESLDQALRHFYRTLETGHNDRIIYTESAELSSTFPLLPLTPESMRIGGSFPESGTVWIDGLINSETLHTLQSNVKKNFERLLALDRYDFDVLSRVRDFRTLVNVSYVVYLSRQLGISTKLEPVLSFPLGPNSISIMEAATAYQSITTGQGYRLSSEYGAEMTPIIEKIVDREGEILWQHRPKPKRVISDRVSCLVREILRNVMENGTGRKARDAVQVFSIPVPSFGKTGTSNRFTNSSFVGVIPGPDQKTGELDLQEGYVIAAYVGYDDNRPMKGEHVAIYGASGAMPLWIDTANAIVNRPEYRARLQPADLVFNPLPGSPANLEGFQEVPVSPLNGLPRQLSFGRGRALSGPKLLTDVEDDGTSLRLMRRLEPVEGETD